MGEHWESEAIALYERGLSLRDVGSRVGVSGARVHQVFVRDGIARRAMGRPSPKRERERERGKLAVEARLRRYSARIEAGTITLAEVARREGVWHDEAKRVLGRPPKRPCGTAAALARHRARGETCNECLAGVSAKMVLRAERVAAGLCTVCGASPSLRTGPTARRCRQCRNKK